MNLTEGIKTRRSIRKFTGQIIEQKVLKEVVEAASFAPSWKNTQTPRYVIVQNPELKEKIAREGVLGFTYNEGTILGCQALVVITSLKNRCGYERDGSFTTKKGDRWEMFDAGVAAQTLMLAAWDKGIGSVTLGIFDEDYIAEVLGIGEEYQVSALVAMGYPAEEPQMPKRKSVDELVRFL